jgi:NAD-dependent dihydropyrimidine dehydrogenase PreA subunit
MASSVPRNRIPWFPKIDLDGCIGDQECVEFCKNGVFVWDEVRNRPEVIRPFHCVVGCDACSQICPAEAIRFPSREELRRTMRNLVQEARQTAGESA